ncbi:MAG: hypothetical protein GY749_34335 [Desulfobacteraceae bacterium]|nr:hypothetical protein [Desulfobacteraceae bacterium]
MGLIRYIIVFGVIYFGYKKVKSLLLGVHQRTVSGKARNEIDDIMIKDPFCKIYFPRKEGVHLKIDEQDLYFCSTRCRDGFIASHNYYSTF